MTDPGRKSRASADPVDPEATFIQTARLRQAVLESGPEDGPLVLLVHGFPDTPHTWSHIRPVLAEQGWRVVCPYQRGYAPSEIPADGKYDDEALGRDLVALLDALGAEKAVLVGHDWGALAVYAAAALAPERVRHAVTVAIPYVTTLKPSLGKLWGARHFFTLRLPGAAKRFAKNDYAQLDVLYRRWSPGFDWPESEYAAAKRSFRQPGSTEAALAYYAALSPTPTAFLRQRQTYTATVLGGLTDGVATPEDFERSKKAYEDGACTVKMLPGGHFLHREHPEAFEAALLEALEPFGPHGGA